MNIKNEETDCEDILGRVSKGQSGQVTDQPPVSAAIRAGDTFRS